MPPPHLPALARAQCDVLVAFVNHLVAYKAHKTKLFQYEGKPSERKKLLEMFYNGASPTTAALKHVSSRSMSYVIRHVLSTQYAPLLSYAAFQTLATAVQSPAIVNILQSEINRLPSAHAELLHVLCHLIHTVTKQLMVAEDALITHLGVYFCRPSESPKELQDSLNARKAICRTLLRNLPSLQFTHPMEAPPRRRSTYRPWTLEMAQHMRLLLEAIAASPAKKRDLFLRLTDSSLVSQVVDPSYAGPVDAMSVHTLAGALKLMLQRTDALVGRDVFSFARSSDSPVADLSRAVLALDPTRKRLVLLLWRCIQQALIDGASLELLSSALSGHIFEELKPPRDPSANHMLDRTAIEVLKNLDTLLRLCCPRFRSVALVVLTAQRWLAACRERNADSSQADILDKSFLERTVETTPCRAAVAVDGAAVELRRKSSLETFEESAKHAFLAMENASAIKIDESVAGCTASVDEISWRSDAESSFTSYDSNQSTPSSIMTLCVSSIPSVDKIVPPPRSSSLRVAIDAHDFIFVKPSSIAEHMVACEYASKLMEVHDLDWGYVADMTGYATASACRAVFESLNLPLIASSAVWKLLHEVYCAYMPPSVRRLSWSDALCFCKDCHVDSTVLESKAILTMNDLLFHEFYALVHNVAHAVYAGTPQPMRDLIIYNVVGFAKRRIATLASRALSGRRNAVDLSTLDYQLSKLSVFISVGECWVTCRPHLHGRSQGHRNLAPTMLDSHSARSVLTPAMT
ncbi:unnamed protein product [Aphanomyces euteiches]